MSRLRRLVAALRLEGGPAAVAPWAGVFERDARLALLRQAALAACRQELQLGRLELTAAALAWPLVSTQRALRRLAVEGRHVAQAHGVRRRRQLLDMLLLAHTQGLSPEAYYHARLFQPEGRARARACLQTHELRHLQRTLLRSGGGPSVDHKLEWYAHCRRHGLPAPRPVAAAEAGRLVWWEVGSGGRLPAADLVLKPIDRYGGRGFERWDVEGDGGGARWRRAGQGLDQAGLLARLEATSRTGPALLQERLAPHADLVPLGPRALCTARVITASSSARAPVVFHAELRMPRDATTEVDNVSAGGLVAPVRLADGRVGPAVSSRLEEGSFTRHPTTGARITGLRLPHWDAALELCRRAHATVAGIVSIGWDVGLTAGGPYLVEANTAWALPEGCLLGEVEAFVACALEELERRAGRGGYSKSSGSPG